MDSILSLFYIVTYCYFSYNNCILGEKANIIARGQRNVINKYADIWNNNC